MKTDSTKYRIVKYRRIQGSWTNLGAVNEWPHFYSTKKSAEASAKRFWKRDGKSEDTSFQAELTP